MLPSIILWFTYIKEKKRKHGSTLKLGIETKIVLVMNISELNIFEFPTVITISPYPPPPPGKMSIYKYYIQSVSRQVLFKLPSGTLIPIESFHPYTL